MSEGAFNRQQDTYGRGEYANSRSQGSWHDGIESPPTQKRRPEDAAEAHEPDEANLGNAATAAPTEVTPLTPRGEFPTKWASELALSDVRPEYIETED